MVKLLLNAGADIHSKDNATPLIYAALDCNSEVVKLLLNAGAEVDVRDKDGKTALMRATEESHLEIQELWEQEVQVRRLASEGRERPGVR